MLQLSGTKPIPGVLFGITHQQDGSLILREPKVLKVGIGLPLGRALNTWIHNDGKWAFRMGVKGSNGKLEFKTATGIATRKDAEAFYHANYAKAEICNYPRKLGFFTFTKPVLQEDGTEVFEPDFEAIETHGSLPTEIDIVCLDDNPFSGAYQMWSASELRCKGDGINALRVLSMAGTDEEKKLAEEAKQNDERYFPIIDGCWTRKCPFSRETVDDRGRSKPSPCKPGGDLKFQLARNIRVGGTAYFHSSGYRSISHIFSSLERIKSLTSGRLAGIPLKMVLRPYKTKHNGQAATQYGVSLEFRAQDIETLRTNLIEQAWKFRQAAVPTVQRHLLDAPAEPVLEEDDDESPFSAQAISDEFYGGVSDDDEEPGPSPVPAASSGAAAATQAKAANLAEKLQQKTAKKPVEPSPEPEPQPVKPANTPVEGDLF